MPFTPLKGLSIQTGGTNTGTWGAGTTSPANQDLNNGVMLVLDNNLAGISTISLSSSNYTFTATDIGNACHRFIGTLLANVSVGPGGSTLYNGFYYWENLTGGSFSLTVTTNAGSVVLPQNRRGVLFVDSVNGPRLFSIQVTSNQDVIPAGTNMLFKQSSVPTGWTQDTSINDYGMRIVNGTGNVGHGVTAFSTVFNQTSTAGYALQVADLAPHSHSYNRPQWNLSPSGGTSGGNTLGISTGDTTGSTGSGNAHAHGISMQPLYVDIITGTKN